MGTRSLITVALILFTSVVGLEIEAGPFIADVNTD
jgi:hypothetical protein